LPKPGKRRFSLAARITVFFALTVALMSGAAAAVTYFFPRAWIVFSATLALGLSLGIFLVRRSLFSVNRALRMIADGIQSFKDRDFSMRLAETRNDELGELLTLYNHLGDLLREERSSILQRELMLDTVLQSTPTAVVLTNARDRIVFSNRAARQMFFGGRKPEGHSFREILEGCPAPMREIVDSDSDALFTVESRGEQETFHLSKRPFRLNAQVHTLYMFARLTRELSRQEVEVWKKVIRVISHELNNSLAPISSMLHSAKTIKDQPQHAHRLDQVFDAIGERMAYLKSFLEGYARFARLPKPKKQSVSWPEFLARVSELYAFELEGEVPREDGFFDPSQIQQVLINLLKNAIEASSGADNVRVRIDSSPEFGSRILVMDRGKGMEEEVLKQSLLPFYSTKQAGMGLGLPLCREILEAHGGQIQIQNREGGGLMVTCFLPPHPRRGQTPIS